MEVGGVSDKNWLSAQLDYLSHLRRIFPDKNASRFLIIKLILRNINRRICVINFLQYLKSQIIFILLAYFNFIHSILIIKSMRRILYSIAGFSISKSAVINGCAKFFSFRRLYIGNNSVINTGVYLDNRVGIHIGSNVSISHDVKIYTLGHDINSACFSTKGKSVYIDDYAVIFAGAVLMPGVRVSKGAVIYPYSVVYENVGEMDVVAGNPARVIKKRNSLLKYKLKYDYLFAI
jgi:acetyltransferase-like isoleucine patch superfamily enzyme